jgi:flagellin-specific chaperone FliS
MSCLGTSYNPIPPRVWSRVQNRCPTINSTTTEYVFIPQLNRNVLFTNVENELQMLRKGNILQYKGNSSRLTKNERYSKIAQGKWVNRTTTWASQSEQVTNPNTTLLKRINVKGTITLDGLPTTLPLSTSFCQVNPIVPIKIPTSNNNNNNNIINPIKLPKTSYKPNSTAPITIKTFPSYTPPIINPTVINDGGTLVCTTQVNPCNGEIINKTYVSNCNFTSASDVPGPIQLLCYNDGLPTYFPRQRYIMTNSTSKWPEGAKFIRSANSTESSNPVLKTYLLSLKNKNTISNNTSSNNNTPSTNTPSNNTSSTSNENNSNNDFLNAYNNVINNTSIQLVSNYLNEFLTNDNTTNLKNILTSTQVTTLKNNINLLSNSNYPSLSYILNTYNNILSSLYHTLNECDCGTINQVLFEKYKMSDTILNNATLLSDFISKKPSSKTSLFNVSLQVPLLEINPIYSEYIKLYGIPKDFIFDPTLLAGLVQKK